MELFGTAGIRGGVDDRVTPALSLRVGQAAGREAVATDGSAEFVVGRDGRTTGEGLAEAVTAGLLAAGADVVGVGVVPTPALAFASRGRHGVMVTASHNPPTDNGLKLFVDGVEYGDRRESAVAHRVEAGTDPAAWTDWGTSHTASVVPSYRSAVVEYAATRGSDPTGLRVAVDCGNGVAADATPAVLDRLGVSVVTLNANVDGHFPGRASKPTPESLGVLREFVADDGPALGVAHDGDGDRIVVVDGDGEVVHEDTVVALLAADAVAASDAADPVVVTTPNASARVDELVEAAGGSLERVRLGALHEGVAAVRESGRTVAYAAEPWKHLHPGLGGWIDAVATAAVLVRLVAGAAPDPEDPGGGLAALRDRVSERPYRKENVPCPDGLKTATMDRLGTALPAAFEEGCLEDTEGTGIRLTFPDASWVLVRPSGTEPYVRVYAESDDVDTLVARTLEVVEAAVEAAG
jgi:phosphomannomutase